MKVFYNKKAAFTLIEMSVVLVVIALLIAAILGGQELIRQAELRSIVTQKEQYQTAVNTFRDQYKAIPGDIPNAYMFWGTEAGCTNADVNVTASGCNGNGDNRVSNHTATTTHRYQEAFRAWQHLSLAGMVEGTYTGVTAGSNPYNAYYAIAGQNVPASKFPGGAFMIESIRPYTGISWYKLMDYGNTISFGNPVPAPGVLGVRGFILTSDEAWNIDKKLDDGWPTKGSILIYGDSDCRDGSITDLESPYNLDNDVISCALIMRYVW